jgi:hypothetical protein
MIFILKQFKEIFITAMCMLLAVTAMSQVKHKHVTTKSATNQLKDFYHLAAEANVQFTFPAGFKEIPVINDEDFTYDYAMEIPGREFDIWFQVKPQKGEWVNYERLKNDASKQLANPDSSYIDIGRAQASAFAGDQNYYTKNISPDVLARYNASAGKSYIINLQDLPATKRYKYALLLTLQKDHVGTILAICFTNEKNAEFFRNVNRISRYLKFKP